MPARGTSKLLYHQQQVLVPQNRITLEPHLLLLKKLPLVNIWDVPIASCELCIHLQGHLGTPKGLHNLHKCFIFLWTATESKYCYRDIRANDLLSPSFQQELGIFRKSWNEAWVAFSRVWWRTVLCIPSLGLQYLNKNYF